jgi:uncharacterized protein YxjI
MSFRERRQERLHVTDTCGVEVEQDCDSALILAITAVLDQMAHRDR